MDNRDEATLRIFWQADTHAIFFLEGDRKSNILLYMYRKKSSGSSEQKSSLNYKTIDSQALNQFSDLSKLTGPEPLEWRVDHVPLKEGPHVTDKNYSVNLFVSFIQWDLWAFNRVIMHWSKGYNHIFQGLLRYWLWYDIISRRLKTNTMTFLSEEGIWGAQTINEV